MSESDRSTSARPPSSETILLIDDNDMLRSVMRRMLEPQGYRVLLANDGEAALDLLATYDGPIDLVITDVVLPGLTGPPLIERLAAGRPPFKVIVISGYPDVDLVRRRVRALGGEWLEKPFDMPDFVRTVREVLDSEARGRWDIGPSEQP